MRGPHLPTQLTSLIGREDDLEAVGAALSSTRLLTLTGPGGVGKTRLAVEAAARGAGGFPDGVWWIELAALSDPDAIASTLVQALGVRPLPGLSEVDAAIGFLYQRRALLVVDNCEHVAGAVASVAAALLRACPALSILATSRVPLALDGETRWAVPPLSLPADDGLAGLSGSAAAHLFVDRAGRVDRRWPLDEEGTTGYHPSGMRVDVRLWGDDEWYDDALGGPYVQYYDWSGYYSVSFCANRSTLDEDIGQDELYAGVRVYDRATGAQKESVESNRIRRYF